MKKKIYLAFVLSISSIALMAQVKIGANPTSISSNSTLETESTNGNKTHVNKDNGNVGIGNVTPNSTLTVNGSFSAGTTSVSTTAYTILATDFLIAWSGTADGTATLPAAGTGNASIKGRMYIVKNSTANFLYTVTPATGETIDGQATCVVGPNCQVILQSTGAASGLTWQILTMSCQSLVQIPVWSGRLTSDVTPAVNGSGFPTPLTNISSISDQGSLFDASTGTYTCIMSGVYEIQMTITHYETHSGGNARGTCGLISVNGGETYPDGTTVGAGYWVARNQFQSITNEASVMNVGGTAVTNAGTGDGRTQTFNVSAKLKKGNKYQFGLAQIYNGNPTDYTLMYMTSGGTGKGAASYFSIRYLSQ